MSRALINNEIRRLRQVYQDESELELNEIAESAPLPTPLSRSLIEYMYSAEGALGLATGSLGGFADWEEWKKQSCLDTAFGRPVTDPARERKIFLPSFWQKIKHGLIEFNRFREHQELYLDSFYSDFLPNFIQLADAVKPDNIPPQLLEFNTYYRHAFILRLLLVRKFQTLARYLEPAKFNQLLLLPDHSVIKERIDDKLKAKLQDQSFRIKYELELYCTEALPILPPSSAGVTLDYLLNGVSAQNREYVKKEMQVLQAVLRMIEDNKHISAYFYHRLRENLKLIGKNWDLSEPLDICFLDMAEFNSEHLSVRDKKEIIRINKEKYQAFKNYKISFPLKIAELGGKSPVPKHSGQWPVKVLSSGSAQGEAILYHSRLGINEIKNKILVVPAITPDLAILFPRLKAIITESGSPLSHGALLAREYGLPAAQMDNALQKLKNGKIVKINSKQQKIEVC